MADKESIGGDVDQWRIFYSQLQEQWRTISLHCL